MKIRLIVLIMAAAMLLCACSAAENVPDTNGGRLSYSKLDAMDEVNIDGSTVTVVLGTNRSLPYEWKIFDKSETAELKETYIVSKPNNYSSGAGSSPAFYVFVFELSGNKRDYVKLWNKWIYSGNLSDANGDRLFYFVLNDGQWTLE